ncbi:DUF1566 domain-containing protein [bacterium]|nr:DUF1566 domain-containing protein [bacterium]
MKKITLLSLVVALFFFIGCGSSKNDDKDDTDEHQTDEDTVDTANHDDTDNADSTGNETSDSDDTKPETSDDDGNTASETPDNGDTDDTEISDGDSDDSGNDSDTMPDDDTDTAAELTEEEKCVAGNGFWNGSECFHPCDGDPCGGIENSTEKCTPTGIETYSCGCNEGFAWVLAGKACLPAVLGRFCTGQTKCFNEKNQEIECPAQGEDFYGQDAQYAAKGLCIPQNFEVKTLEGKNVIEDLNTKLMWQQEIPEGLYLWEEAAEYCENLNYAGFDDWRLPRPEELLSIVDSGMIDPALDTDLFTKMISVNPENDFDDHNNFWSSKNLFPDLPNRVPCFLNISDGSMNCAYAFTDTPYSSRTVCVRGDEFANKAELSEETTENGEVVIKDSSTGLMWQGDPDYSSTLDWLGLFSHCEDLDYAGFTDWRVPSKNELASLLNFDKTTDPFSDFPGIDSQICSSTALKYKDPNDYYADKYTLLALAWFDNGEIYSSIAASCETICVR